jgi:hypothetical protein
MHTRLVERSVQMHQNAGLRSRSSLLTPPTSKWRVRETGLRVRKTSHKFRHAVVDATTAASALMETRLPCPVARPVARRGDVPLENHLPVRSVPV